MSKKIKLSRNKEAIVDDDDYEYLIQWKWFCSTKGYALRNSKNNDGFPRRNIWMHRVVLNLDNNKIQVDHINENKLDNRKENLRLANNSENQFNISKCRKGTSKYKGVQKRTRKNTWKVTINANKKSYYLGDFINEEDAARAYNKAAIKYHGKFAKLNDLDKPKRK